MADKNIKIIYNEYLLLIFFFFSFTSIFGTNYYVDSKHGNDKNYGLTPKYAWQSIQKVNNSQFQPGDSILFKSGCVWREELNLSSSGSLTNPIVISSYANGLKPKILGSSKISVFQNIEPNIWKAQIPKSAGWIWFINNNNKLHWGKKEFNANELNENYEFYLDSNSVLFYLDKDPTIEKIMLEASVRDFGIITGWYGEAHNNIIIDNLEICFTKNSNVRIVAGENWIIRNIDSHHSGAVDESDGQGIQIEGKNNVISSSKFYENGQHGIYLSSFGNSHVDNNIIEQNIIYNNYHTGIDLMNDGGGVDCHQNTIIRRNYIYDESNFEGNEVGIQTLGYGDGYVKNVIIHHNIIQNINGIGISIVTNSDSIFVHNNTVYETKSACFNIDNNAGYAELYNNIGVNNTYYAVVFFHNIESKMIDHNVWNTNSNTSTKNVLVGNHYYNNQFEYQEKFKIDLNGNFNDPKLVIINEKIVGIYDDSNCINSGKKMNYKYDYFGLEINGNFDIGAIEYKK